MLSTINFISLPFISFIGVINTSLLYIFLMSTTSPAIAEAAAVAGEANIVLPLGIPGVP